MDDAPADLLTSRQRLALREAAADLVDLELSHLQGTAGMERSPLSELLPPAGRGLHAFLAHKQILIAVVTVGQKLAVSDLPDVTCVAEEVALYLIVNMAVGRLDLEEVEHPGFETYLEFALQDADAELLWDPSIDGIEDSAAGELLGLRNLDPREWGVRFGNTGPPHPLLERIARRHAAG